MCVSGLAVPQLATASLCQVQCQSAFIKDPGASNVLASVLSCHYIWAQQVSKCWYLSTMYSHGVTAHKTVIFTVTFLGTSHSLVCYMPCKLIPICMYLGSFLYTFVQNWSFEWVTLPVIVWEVPGLDLSPECLS